MTATTHNCRVTLYRGYTIEQTEEFWRTQFVFFPTDKGRQDDGEFTDGGFRYTGNCKWADSIEEAKDLIDDKIMSEYPAFYKVETYALIWNIRLPIITKFTWLSEALNFASKRNGILIAEFKSV